MLWLKILFLLICVASISSSEEPSSSAETNEIDPKEAVRKIDPTLREALLRAIDKLEKQAAAEAEEEEEGDEDQEAEDESEEETATRKEELLEESTLSDDIIPTVQFFTASIDKTEDKPEDNLLKSILDNTAKPKDTSDDGDIKINFGIPALVAQNVLPLDTSQQTRSIDSDNSNEIANEISEPKKITLISTTRPPRRRTTTTEGTTTTRKPAPTHNEDGENIEVVEKEDIKILQAPLVTAFTVHQDEQGAAKKVIPLFQPPVPPPPLPPSPVQSPIIINPVPQPLIQQNSDTEIIKSTTTILLPTPLPAADHSNTNFGQPPSPIQNLQAQLPVPSFLQGIIPQNQSLPIVQSNQIPFSPSPSLQQQSVFSVQETPQPLPPTFTPQTPSINDYLLERQRLLEQQIYQLQLQARQQQEQILHQQRLLFEQQSKKFEQQNNQVKSTNNFKDITIRPSLEVLPSISQAPRFEFNTELQLPVKEAVNFRPTFNPAIPHHRTSIQIQPSNQVNFPPQQHVNLQSQQQPLELSTFQQLPQKTFQSFNPNSQFLGPVNPSLLKSGTSDQNSIHRTRHFRQESGTGNFGFNNFFSPNQNFQRSGSGHSSDSQRQNNLFQPALNHGISPHTPQNLHFNGQFRDSF